MWYTNYNKVSMHYRKVNYMRIQKYIPILLVATFFGSTLITGCNQENAKLVPSVPQNIVETKESPTESISETEETKTENEPVTIEETSESMLSLTITIENQCGADIGMFSVIDPVTKEQVNVEGITNGDSLSIQANWPSSISDFQWAIYNKNGDLYTEATTDISQANESVIITLQGDGSIDTINTTFK